MNNINAPHHSPWIEALCSEQHKDPYALFKDSIKLMLETDALKIQNELIKAHPEYTKEIALKMAICLMMERMLVLQKEHAPTSLDSMITSLFTELPSLQNFRTEIIEQAKIEVQKNEKKRFFSKLFCW